MELRLKFQEPLHVLFAAQQDDALVAAELVRRAGHRYNLPVFANGEYVQAEFLPTARSTTV